TTLGLLDSPRAVSQYARTHTTGTLLPFFGGKTIPPREGQPSSLNLPDPGWLTKRTSKALGFHQPETPGEKTLDSATQLPATRPFGGAASAGKLAANLGLNAAGGAASEYARQKTEGIKVPDFIDRKSVG